MCSPRRAFRLFGLLVCPACSCVVFSDAFFDTAMMLCVAVALHHVFVVLCFIQCVSHHPSRRLALRLLHPSCVLCQAAGLHVFLSRVCSGAHALQSPRTLRSARSFVALHGRALACVRCTRPTMAATSSPAFARRSSGFDPVAPPAPCRPHNRGRYRLRGCRGGREKALLCGGAALEPVSVRVAKVVAMLVRSCVCVVLLCSCLRTRGLPWAAGF